MSNALYLVWNQQHETGNMILDEQYRAMLGIINSLYHSSLSGDGLKILKPTLRVLEEMSYIHLSTIGSLTDEANFELYRERAVFQYELFLEAKKTASEVRSEQDIQYVVRMLKDWWVNFYVEQAA